MKKLSLYTGIVVIVLLGATSCARRACNDNIEVSRESFQEAEIDDGPSCGCEDSPIKDTSVNDTSVEYLEQEQEAYREEQLRYYRDTYPRLLLVYNSHII